MTTLDAKIFSLKSDIFDWKLALKPLSECNDDDREAQVKIRCHINELQAELDNLLEQNRAEEEIEGW